MAFNLNLKLASHYAKFIPQQKIIMVTGSIGKSSTITAAQAVLEEVGSILVIESILKQPQKLLNLRPNIKWGLFEINLNHSAEPEKILSIIKPEVVLVTCVSDSGLQPVEQQTEEISRLILELPKNGAAILNWDDPICRRLAEKTISSTESEVIFYGTDPKNCHLWAGNIQFSQFRVIFELNYGVERVEVTTNFISKPQIYSLLAASALGLKMGLRLTQIKSKIEKVKPLNHKMEVIPGFNGSTILDSSFDGAPASTESAIDSLNFVPARRRIAVLGPMIERTSPEKLYRNIAQKIYQDKLDLVLLGKGEPQIIADELLKLGFIAGRLEQDLTNPQIVSSLLKVLGRGDLVLVKGSKDVRLDEVVAKITKK